MALPSALLRLGIWITLLLMAGCSGSNDQKNSQQTTVRGCDRIPSFKADLEREKKLNINVLIDISYRIAPGTAHGKRALKHDLAVLEQLALIWKKHICRKPLKAYNDEFHIRLNEPIPEGLGGYFDKLSFDAGSIYQQKSDAEFKRFLSHFEDTVTQRARKIYQTVYDKGYQTADNWIGSNIYGFFQNSNQLQKCIEPNADNVLVVLTDGYISHAEHNQNFDKGLAFNNLVEQKFQDGGLLCNQKLSVIKQKGYHLKPIATDLSSLEVVIAGVDPHVNARDGAKLRYLLNKWLAAMNVEQKAIYKSKGAIARNQEDLKAYFYRE